MVWWGVSLGCEGGLPPCPWFTPLPLVFPGIPRDRGSLIYLALVLCGVGFLLPYNSFITAVDFYQVSFGIQRFWVGGRNLSRMRPQGCRPGESSGKVHSLLCSEANQFMTEVTTANPVLWRLAGFCASSVSRILSFLRRRGFP